VINRNFRTDPASGLVFHEQGEKLIRWNAVAGVVSLLVGGVLALLVILTRWPAVHLLPADWFYLVLTAHGVDMLIVWIIFFEIAVLYFCATVLLRCRLAAPRWGVGGLLADDHRRAREQRRRVPRRLERDVHLLRADGRSPRVLSRPDPVRRRRADRLLRVLRHAGRGQGGAHVQRLAAARHVRRRHRRHHRRCSRSRRAPSS
jgi:hypothetical protein